MTQMPNAAAAERWNGASGEHWVTHRERHEISHRPLVAHLFQAAGIRAGDRVLDVGCGCGETTLRAARLAAGEPAGGTPAPPVRAGEGLAGPGGGGSALGLDLSATMLAEARRLAADAALGNVSFEQGDAQVFPLPPDSFDVAISAFGVMFFSDPAAAFANVRAAVRPGGRLAFLCWQDDSQNEYFSIPARAFGCDVSVPGQAHELFTEPQRITKLLTSAGWSDIEIGPLSEPAWLGDDAADVMEYMRGMAKVRALITELGDPGRAEVALAAMAAEYRAYQQPDGVWVGTGAWLVRAQRG
ncbi:MAG TPA: methyltransferase domain-containing protein [Streptosporangiaceae bacterium]|jgi:SAM-dependent methyltransferase